jgi:hypothetical protein
MKRGDADHRRWERLRGDENECNAEKRFAEEAQALGADMRHWWDQWFERSDDWREEMGYVPAKGW